MGKPFKDPENRGYLKNMQKQYVSWRTSRRDIR